MDRYVVVVEVRTSRAVRKTIIDTAVKKVLAAIVKPDLVQDMLSFQGDRETPRYSASEVTVTIFTAD